ncbi:kinase-like protein [Aureobasidium subglaciale]|nr:kinase-like protein [Aureobasidium subglaciale]
MLNLAGRRETWLTDLSLYESVSSTKSELRYLGYHIAKEYERTPTNFGLCAIRLRFPPQTTWYHIFGDSIYRGRYLQGHTLKIIPVVLKQNRYIDTGLEATTQSRRNVALKITVSEASTSGAHAFKHVGPNGTHDCLILELLGPSVPTVIEARYPDGRLPGTIATKLCKETSLALDVLHKQGIGHGDLHTGNIVFADHGLSLLSEDELFKKLGTPRIGQVTRSDGSPLGHEVPDYLVWSARLPTADLNTAKPSIKLIDFGESFFLNDRPQTLHTPLAIRAPELLFDDDYDLSVDCWALGCTMFEFVVGYPPVSGLLAKKGDILQQIADMIGEPPERWQPKWKALPKWELSADDEPAYTLEERLELCYFDVEKSTELSRRDVADFGKLVKKLLQWQPSARSSVVEVLSDDWLKGR